jgi:hypothetical protein
MDIGTRVQFWAGAGRGWRSGRVCCTYPATGWVDVLDARGRKWKAGPRNTTRERT